MHAACESADCRGDEQGDAGILQSLCALSVRDIILDDHRDAAEDDKGQHRVRGRKGSLGRGLAGHQHGPAIDDHLFKQHVERADARKQAPERQNLAVDSCDATPVLPYMLAFAAGAMFYVVVEELIPEASSGRHSNLSTIGFAIGFVLMMVLDVVMG